MGLAFFLPESIECKGCSSEPLAAGAIAGVEDNTVFLYDPFFNRPELKGQDLHQEGVLLHETIHLWNNVRNRNDFSSVWITLQDPTGQPRFTKKTENLENAAGEMARYSADPGAHAATTTGGYFGGENLSSGLLIF
jgi:hypothetical protein